MIIKKGGTYTATVDGICTTPNNRNINNAYTRTLENI